MNELSFSSSTNNSTALIQQKANVVGVLHYLALIHQPKIYHLVIPFSSTFPNVTVHADGLKLQLCMRHVNVTIPHACVGLRLV